jgi:SagB-type dehydrogenase family enzyme
MRIRRINSLIFFYERNQFIAHNYLTNKQTIISPLILHMLQQCKHNEYYNIEDVPETFKILSDAMDIINQLIKCNIFAIEGSGIDKKDILLEEKWRWKNDVRYFHYSIQYTYFEDNLVKESNSLAKLAKENPPPQPYKNYDNAMQTELLGTFDDQCFENDFWKLLIARRTVRKFKREKISLNEFSTLLLFTWGKTRELNDTQIGKYVLKTSPSGGSRHPIEVYPIALRVEGIEPGIYHYSVQNHKIELIRNGNFEDLAVALCANQYWVRDASVVFFMTAVVERNMWKYSQSHAYKVILLDAGHLGQTFHLVCTKLGLAPFTTAATTDLEIEKELDLDGVSEIPVYTAVAGKPALVHT